MGVRENDKKRFQLETNVVFRIYIVTHLGYIVWVTCCFVVVGFVLGFFTKHFMMGVRENDKKRFQLKTNVVFCIYIVTHVGYIVWVTCCFVVVGGFLLFFHQTNYDGS